MNDPQPIGGANLLNRFRHILAARGLSDIETGPTDTTPTPNDPGHPDYHRNQRAAFALARWEAATPYRYRTAIPTHPGITAWADHAATDIRDAGFLVLTGTIGTGKTHQAYGALRAIAASGPARYELITTTAPDMYGRLRPGGSDKGMEHELRRLAAVPLLLLDDLGTEKLSEWTEEATYRLLNERYNQCLPIIVTTNLPVRAPLDDRGQPIGPDLAARLGERLASRLSQAATVVTLTGPDLRRQPRSAA
ncbi:ATP-binding protein [Streptomyces syringium]|uniref:ATP-binding protein n=1 Tax=Streptomyces syringium TaxID=76729 RepID=UPI00343CDD2C